MEGGSPNHWQAPFNQLRIYVQKYKKIILITALLVIILSIIAYKHKNKILIAWNQAIYTSPFEWKNTTLYFDKSNIVFPEDGMITIYSLSKPSSGSVTIIDSNGVKITDIISAHEIDGSFSNSTTTASTFKDFPCTIYKAIIKEDNTYFVSIDIQKAQISISYYGNEKDYPYFKRIIDKIEIRPSIEK